MEKDETMKCIVETTGSFTLINTTSEAILNNRPCVTTNTSFIDVQLNKGKLKVLARNLPRKVTDLEFHDALAKCKGDAKMAIEAFCAEHGVTPEGEKIASEDLEGKAAEEAKKAEEEAKAAEEAKKAEEEAKAAEEAKKAEEEAKAAEEAKKAEDQEVAKRVAAAAEANAKLEEEKKDDKNSESTTSEAEKSDGTADKTDAGKKEENKKQGPKNKKGK